MTKEPELRYTTNNTPVATFTLAIGRKAKDNENNADFINCVAWGKTGEFVSKYFVKGQEMLLVGRIQVRDYDKEGKKVYVTEVIAEEVEFCGSKTTEIQVNAIGGPDDDLSF